MPEDDCELFAWLILNRAHDHVSAPDRPPDWTAASLLWIKSLEVVIWKDIVQELQP